MIPATNAITNITDIAKTTFVFLLPDSVLLISLIPESLILVTLTGASFSSTASDLP